MRQFYLMEYLPFGYWKEERERAEDVHDLSLYLFVMFNFIDNIISHSKK